MKMRSAYLRIHSGFICLLTLGGASPLNAVEAMSQTMISRVAPMPNLPQPYSMRDWSQVTRDYINMLFDFEQRGDHLPLVSWIDEKQTMVSMPAFIGGPSDPEAINYLVR